MISTAVGAVLGFFAALIPEIINYYRNKSLTPSFNGQVTDGTTIPVSASDEIPQDLPIDNRFLNFLRGSVRPVLTYAFFALFVYVKIKALHVGIGQEPVVTLLPVVWDEEASVLLAAIVAFWFGSRLFRKR